MTIRIEDTTPVVRVSVRVNVLADDDTTDLQPEYSSVPTKRFRPNILRLEYVQTPSEPTWRCTSASVTGYVVKKDGKLSQSATGKFVCVDWLGRVKFNAPEWVRDMIASNTPADYYWTD